MSINNVERVKELISRLEKLETMLGPSYDELYIAYHGKCFKELFGEKLWPELQERVRELLVDEKNKIEKELLEL